MVINTNPTENADGGAFVTWSDRLAIGIELIDTQHKQLVHLTNELYQACLRGGDVLDAAFKNAMGDMVKYVQFHFKSEQDMLQRVNYPNYAEHKKEHDSFVKEVLETTKDYGGGKKFVPNNFVRFLRDWIISHIGHSDKMYAAYISNQIKQGLLTHSHVNGQ